MAKSFKDQAKGVLNPESPVFNFITPTETAAPTLPEPEQPPARKRVTTKRIEAKSRRVQLLIKPSVHAAILEIVEESGESFNEWANAALEAALKKQERKRKG